MRPNIYARGARPSRTFLNRCIFGEGVGGCGRFLKGYILVRPAAFFAPIFYMFVIRSIKKRCIFGEGVGGCGRFLKGYILVRPIAFFCNRFILYSARIFYLKLLWQKLVAIK